MLTKFGAVRTRNTKMEMVYCLPGELSIPNTSSPLKNLVLDVDYNDMLIVIKTSPGAAQLIARLLDSIGKIRRHLRYYRRRWHNFYHTNAWYKKLSIYSKMFNVYLKTRCNEHFINWGHGTYRQSTCWTTLLTQWTSDDLNALKYAAHYLKAKKISNLLPHFQNSIYKNSLMPSSILLVSRFFIKLGRQSKNLFYEKVV